MYAFLTKTLRKMFFYVLIACVISVIVTWMQLLSFIKYDDGLEMQKMYNPLDGIASTLYFHNESSSQEDTQKDRIYHMVTNLPSHELNDTYCLKDRRIFVDYNRKIIYCHVAKTGSTFWMRVFNIIRKNLEYHDPFAIPRGLVHRDIMEKWSYENIDTSGWIKFLFVRNPFERILSTYIDKFVSPNIYYFLIARYLIQMQRQNPKRESLQCGYDISFEEYINSVLSKETPDEHWCPIYRLCAVSKITYSFVGKTETFTTDLKAVLKKVDREHKIEEHSNNTQTDEDILTINIKRVFDFESLRYYQVLNCSFLDFSFALQRFWKVLQIKGIIDHLQALPFSSEKPSLTEGMLRNAVLSAMENSFKQYSKNDLRKYILSKAFSTLSRETKDRFLKHFYYDFKMFGYSTILEIPTQQIDWDPFLH